MKLYINDTFECFLQNDGTRREVDVPLLDGKCRAYIEGMRYVPQGETWRFTDEDGTEHEITGATLMPWRDASALEAAQSAYEGALAALRGELQPETLNRVEAQTTYTAMMTGTLLPEEG